MADEFDDLRDDPRVAEGDISLYRAAVTGEGLVPLSPGSIERLGEMASARWDEAQHDLSEMTQEQAEFVRRLRVDDGYTWRAVAATCHLEWGGDWSPPSNQIWGMAICERAAEMLGGHYMDDTWN